MYTNTNTYNLIYKTKGAYTRQFQLELILYILDVMDVKVVITKIRNTP